MGEKSRSPAALEQVFNPHLEGLTLLHVRDNLIPAHNVLTQ